MIYAQKKLFIAIILVTWISITNCMLHSSAVFSGNHRGFRRHLRDQSTSNESPDSSKDLIYRLPKTVKPISYNLQIIPCFSSFLSFIGKTIIQIKILEDTKTITLHSHQLEIHNITVPDNKVIRTYHNTSTQQSTLLFTKMLKVNQVIELTFNYVGLLNDNMEGLYKNSYVENNKTRWIVSTHFQPTFARRVFPCFDEPAFKATFKISIAVPKTYTTLSNMGSHFEKEPYPILDREWHKYNESVKMSTYLVAFAITDFQKVQQPNSSVSAWRRHNSTANFEHASAVGHVALKFLENLFQYDYVLDEMNFILVPDFKHGGMENWGLISFKEEALLYNINESGPWEKMATNFLISHESVHMWFGNLVTLDWWKYMWLNEGFAEYLGTIVSDKVEPTWEYQKMFVPAILHIAFNADSAESSHSMNNQVHNSLAMELLFDDIAYHKSASVLRMFHKSFGDTVFYSVLQKYIKRYAYKNTIPEQFIAEFERYFKMDNLTIKGNPEVNVTTIMNSWITQAGYPVVTAVRQENNITFQQERFLMSPTSDKSFKNMKYWIPITYTTQIENNFSYVKPRFWLGKSEKQISIDTNSTWFIVNIEQVGYYRVNYDENNWNALIDVLNSDNYTTISDINRAQLIDDSLKLAQAGKLNYNIALNITKYLSRETSFYPWKAFFDAVNYVGQRIEGRPEIRELYQKYILSLLVTVYDKYESTLHALNDTHLDQLISELIIKNACYVGHKDCRRQSKDYFKFNITNFTSCDDLRNIPIETALRYLNLNKYSECAKDSKLFLSYLEIIFDPLSTIPKQKKDILIGLIYTTNEIGLDTVLKYLENNITYLYVAYQDWDVIGSLYNSIAEYISTKVQIDYLKGLIQHQKMVNIKSYLQSAVQLAETNYNWFEKRFNQIHQWLENYNKTYVI